MRRLRKPVERTRVAWLVHGPVPPAGVTRSGLGGLRAYASGGIPGSSASLQSRREARVSGALGFNIAALRGAERLPNLRNGRGRSVPRGPYFEALSRFALLERVMFDALPAFGLLERIAI